MAQCRAMTGDRRCGKFTPAWGDPGLCNSHRRAERPIDLREANRWLLIGGPYAVAGTPLVDGSLPESFTPPVGERVRHLPSLPPAIERVYFIKGGDLVKIGKAQDPQARLSDLQCGSPVPLALARVVTGTRGLEADLHRYFAELRHHGEWFDLAAWETVKRQTDAEIRDMAAEWTEAA